MGLKGAECYESVRGRIPSALRGVNRDPHDSDIAGRVVASAPLNRYRLATGIGATKVS
jgi:hypothetical protein